MRAGRSLRLAACLSALVGGLAWALIPPAPAQQPAAEAKLTAMETASHVLNRLAFGPRPGQVTALAKDNWQKWVEEQLRPEAIDDSTVEKHVVGRCPSMSLTLAQLQRLEQAKTKRAATKILSDELREAVLLRAVYGKRQLQEVIVEFWRNHFNVDVNKVPRQAPHYEEHVLRRHTFGKFEDLLLAVAKHPAMLVYLDNYVSTKRGLNENYARELMELHTLGVDNGYTQPDVIALARTLTGWTCGWQGAEYRFFFNAANHDTTPVTVVGLKLGGDGGIADGEKALRHLANHPGTARFIATKLCRYLVHDSPDPKLIDRTVGVYLKTGGDLRAVYRSILFDPEFVDRNNYRAKFKTPFEYVVSVLRATRARVDNPQQLFRELRLMGQPIYECEDPIGYSDQREAWLDPGIMVYRWNFAIALVTGKIKGVEVGQKFVEDIVKTPLASRPRRILELALPGASDPKVLALSSRTTDTRSMLAWALGSPSFQQQ